MALAVGMGGNNVGINILWRALDSSSGGAAALSDRSAGQKDEEMNLSDLKRQCEY